MADNLIQNYVDATLVSAATEFTEPVDPASGKVTERSARSAPAKHVMSSID